MVLTWTVLIVYLILMVAIGVYYRRKTASVADFVLGGRTLGPWFTAFAYGTSYFSAVIFVGYAGKFGWSYGVASTWVGIGNAILGSLLPWMILGRRSRIMSKHMEAKTMPEFFEKRYDSKALKIASAIIIFIFLIPYTASVYNGLSRLFEKGFGIEYKYCIIIMAVFTAAYVILGGYKATALSDFIQGVIMLIGITAVIVAVLNMNGGLSGSVDKMGEIESASGKTGEYASLFGPDPVNLIGVVILTSLGTWGLPQMVGKFYAVKDDRSIKTGTIVSTVFAVVVAGGCYFLGGFGRLFAEVGEGGAPVGGFDGIVPTMMEKLSPFLFAVVLVLVLSASMSTLSSLVLTSSSVFTIDLIKPFKKDMNEKQELLIMRIFIGFFILVSVIIAIFTLENPQTVISSLMGISWGALAGAFLAPFLYGLYSKKITKAAVGTCFVVGVGVTVVHMFIYTLKLVPSAPATLGKLSLASPVNAGAFTMLLGLVLVPIVSAITGGSGKDKAQAEKVFECYSRDDL
ncbi:MAG: sodium/solute symporter [Ruminococcus sp.]|nr:sodium/solute symporter [Ruminococcus sp.]